MKFDCWTLIKFVWIKLWVSEVKLYVYWRVLFTWNTRPMTLTGSLKGILVLFSDVNDLKNVLLLL